MAHAAKDIVVRNKNGLHARPAMEFVDLANSFAAAIKVKRTDEMAVEADGKSIMQMMILEAMPGTPLRIEADGEDADAAVTRLAELFDSFGED